MDLLAWRIAIGFSMSAGRCFRTLYQAGQRSVTSSTRFE